MCVCVYVKFLFGKTNDQQGKDNTSGKYFWRRGAANGGERSEQGVPSSTVTPGSAVRCICGKGCRVWLEKRLHWRPGSSAWKGGGSQGAR